MATSTTRRASDVRYMSDPIEGLYVQHCQSGSAIAAHLPRLRQLARGAALAVEFGVKCGASTTALLLGAERVISYDISQTPEAQDLQALAGDRWSYRIQDSRVATIPDCDLLFIDSQHSYDQMIAELMQHADQVQRWLVCHDTITFGSIAAIGETGRHAWTYQPGQSVPFEALGIRPAIDALMISDPTWHLAAHYTESHGLLVLERRR